MMPKNTLKTLEDYANQVFPQLLNTYQKYSGTSLANPQIKVKDGIGFIQDYLTANLKKQNNLSLIQKVEQIFATLKIESCKDTNEAISLLEKVSYQLILGEEECKKLRSTQTRQEFVNTLRNLPNYAQLQVWTGLLFDAEAALPHDSNPIIALGEVAMFVKPDISTETLYILKWKDGMIKEGKLIDTTKKILTHECAHLLNQQIGNLASLRSNKSLDTEKRLCYMMLDEGAADFFALEAFPSIYNNPDFASQQAKIMKRISRIYGFVNTITSIVTREKSSLNPFKFRFQGYNFFKKIGHKQGLEEVVKILQNPDSVTLEDVAKPKKYLKKIKGKK